MPVVMGASLRGGAALSVARVLRRTGAPLPTDEKKKEHTAAVESRRYSGPLGPYCFFEQKILRDFSTGAVIRLERYGTRFSPRDRGVTHEEHTLLLLPESVLDCSWYTARCTGTRSLPMSSDFHSPARPHDTQALVRTTPAARRKDGERASAVLPPSQGHGRPGCCYGRARGLERTSAAADSRAREHLQVGTPEMCSIISCFAATHPRRPSPKPNPWYSSTMVQTATASHAACRLTLSSL